MWRWEYGPQTESVQQGETGPQWTESGFSKLPLAMANMNGWRLKTILQHPWPRRLWAGVDKFRKDNPESLHHARASTVTVAFLPFAPLYVTLQGRYVILDKLQIIISLQFFSVYSNHFYELFRWCSFWGQVLVWPQNENIWKFLWKYQPLGRNLPKHWEAFHLSFPLFPSPLSLF